MDRHTVDTITDDALDQLYEEFDQLRAELDQFRSCLEESQRLRRAAVRDRDFALGEERRQRERARDAVIALASVRELADRLDAMAATTASANDRRLYTAFASDLRDRLTTANGHARQPPADAQRLACLRARRALRPPQA